MKILNMILLIKHHNRSSFKYFLAHFESFPSILLINGTFHVVGKELQSVFLQYKWYLTRLNIIQISEYKA